MEIKLPVLQYTLEIKEKINGKDQIRLKSFLEKRVQTNQKVNEKQEVKEVILTFNTDDYLEIETETFLIYIVSAKNEKGEVIKVNHELINQILESDAEDYLYLKEKIKESETKINERKKK